MKFGFLVAVTIVLAGAFAVAVNAPRVSEAQQRRPVLLNTVPPPSIPAAQPAANLGDAFAAVVEAVRPTVVFIRSESAPQTTGRNTPFDQFFRDPPGNTDPRPRQGSGSGFIISEDGYIITNNHVVENATRLTVRLLDRRQFEAEIVGRDPNTDVAIIKIDADNLPAVSLGNSDDVRIGEWALAIGNPMGEAFSFTVTAGIVSAKGRGLAGLQQEQLYRIQDFIQTDAAINPGNSGGPLVNIHGQVIGVNSAIASQTGTYTGYGFAIPINLARTVSEQLISTGKVTRAILGVQIREVTAEDAEYVGLDSIYGVAIQDFTPDLSDGPAEAAGLQPGDVIIELDGEHVSYVAELQQNIGFRKPGDRVEVTVARRGGERSTHTVVLGEAESASRVQVARNEEPERRGEPRLDERLGIAVEEVTGDQLARDGIPRRYAGLHVVRVDRNGAAYRYLGEGEIITHVEGERVQTKDELDAALESIRPGTIVSVRTALISGPQTIQTRTVRFRVGQD
jgi:serine protease Do